ncbi:hypothetical protein QYF36_006339 [Acer negundo]|nr:hypothetical protein QYF36_006339 [Acer negundo]
MLSSYTHPVCCPQHVLYNVFLNLTFHRSAPEVQEATVVGKYTISCKCESTAAWWRVFEDGFGDTRATLGTSTSSVAVGGSATDCDEGYERSGLGAVNTDHTAAASCTSTSL